MNQRAPETSICSIYVIKNSANSKVYVGQTWGHIDERFRGHKRPMEKQHSPKLFHAFEKYGRENFFIECITQCSNQGNADYLEISYIKEYDSVNNGYNIKTGGSRGKHSEETKRKMSVASKGKPKSREAVEKQRKSLIGRKASEETKMKMSQSQKGKHSQSRATKGQTWKIIDGKRVWIIKEQL